MEALPPLRVTNRAPKTTAIAPTNIRLSVSFEGAAVDVVELGVVETVAVSEGVEVVVGVVVLAAVVVVWAHP